MAKTVKDGLVDVFETIKRRLEKNKRVLHQNRVKSDELVATIQASKKIHSGPKRSR